MSIKQSPKVDYPDDWADSPNLFKNTHVELSKENIHIGPKQI